MRLSFNEWTVSGEVFYLKELEGEFACSVRIRGTAKREGVFTSNIMEMGCLIQKNVYEQAKKRGLKQYCNARFSGHIESWQRDAKTNPKIMFVVDYIMDIE